MRLGLKDLTKFELNHQIWLIWDNRVYIKHCCDVCDFHPLYYPAYCPLPRPLSTAAAAAVKSNVNKAEPKKKKLFLPPPSSDKTPFCMCKRFAVSSGKKMFSLADKRSFSWKFVPLNVSGRGAVPGVRFGCEICADCDGFAGAIWVCVRGEKVDISLGKSEK